MTVNVNGLEPCVVTALGPGTEMVSGRANNCNTSIVRQATDEVWYVCPVNNKTIIGVQLVDSKGELVEGTLSGHVLRAGVLGVKP